MAEREIARRYGETAALLAKYRQGTDPDFFQKTWDELRNLGDDRLMIRADLSSHFATHNAIRAMYDSSGGEPFRADSGKA